jgi:predicted fused transcriptional regulator/phosphomethylpyrimidine kinase
MANVLAHNPASRAAENISYKKNVQKLLLALSFQLSAKPGEAHGEHLSEEGALKGHDFSRAVNAANSAGL